MTYKCIATLGGGLLVWYSVHRSPSSQECSEPHQRAEEENEWPGNRLQQKSEWGEHHFGVYRGGARYKAIIILVVLKKL